MAVMEVKGFKEYDTALQKLDYAADDTFKEMVSSGVKIVTANIRSALPKFRKHIRQRSAKKNEWGWFGQAQFRGKTRTGAPAALAAIAYNYGRRTRNGGKPVEGKQILQKAVAGSEAAVESTMSQIYNDKLRSLGFEEE